MEKAETNRKRKFERQKPEASILLTSRDLAILDLLRRFRFLKSTQIASFIAAKHEGSSEAKVKRRLQDLFHHGYVDRPRAQLLRYREGDDATFVYALATAGATALKEHKGFDLSKGVSWKNKKITHPNLLHTTEIAEVLMSLELALKDKFLSQDEILNEEGSRLPPLRVQVIVGEGAKREVSEEGIIPDGLFGIRHEDGKRSLYFVEVDRGTMPVKRHGPKQTSLLMKVRTYMAAQQGGLFEKPFNQKFIRTIFVLPNETRLKNVEAMVQEETGGKGTQFLSVTQETIKNELLGWIS